MWNMLRPCLCEKRLKENVDRNDPPGPFLKTSVYTGSNKGHIKKDNGIQQSCPEHWDK